MSVPQFVRDLEAKLLATLTHYLHPFESRLVEKVDTLMATATEILANQQAAVDAFAALNVKADALLAQVQATPAGVLTLEQSDVVSGALATLATDAQTIITKIDSVLVPPTT